jgi:hypothetical protein
MMLLITSRSVTKERMSHRGKAETTFHFIDHNFDQIPHIGKFRMTVKSDHYEKQCYATMEKWTDVGFQRLFSLPPADVFNRSHRANELQLLLRLDAWLGHIAAWTVQTDWERAQEDWREHEFAESVFN